jgi:DNA-binding NarL/FixJ family response regulator
VIYTAYPTVPSACRAYESGADSYISKQDVDSLEKLQQKVRELLDLRRLRDNVRLQYEAQSQAEAAFRTHQAEWGRKYRGKLLLFRGTTLLEAYDSPQDLWDELERHPLSERNELGIVAVQGDIE